MQLSVLERACLFFIQCPRAEGVHLRSNQLKEKCFQQPSFTTLK